jgi:putative membrane protein
MHRLRVIIVGIVTGIVDAVPGVSGATMLLVFGVYEKTIKYMSDFLYNQTPRFVSELLELKFRSAASKIEANNLAYILTLLLGIIVGLVLSLLLFERLLENNSSSVFGLFTGLIIGSSYIIWNRNQEVQDYSNIKWIISGILISLVIVVMSLNTEESILVIFLSGFIASFGMLLPGLSGSFLLLVIGKYSFVTELVSNIFKNPSSLLGSIGIQSFVLTIGVLLGVSVNLKTVSYFIEKNRSGSMSLILGLVVGGVLAPIREYLNLEQQEPTLYLSFFLVALVATLLISAHH